MTPAQPSAEAGGPVGKARRTVPINLQQSRYRGTEGR
jgi:hypothetical protein